MAAPKEKTNVVTAIVFDFETGGLKCDTCAATQITLKAMRLDTFEVMETYSSYILPYPKKSDIGKPKRKVLKDKYADDEIEYLEYGEKALLVTGITMELLESEGKPLEDVCVEICDFIERNTLNVAASNKPILVGHNVMFDCGFMQQIMLYTDNWKRFIKLVRGHEDFWGNFQPTYIDTIVLCQLAFDDDPSIVTWYLGAMSEKLGIELYDAHNAEADVEATKEMLRLLTAKMRNGGSGVAVGMLGATKEQKTRDYFKI